METFLGQVQFDLVLKEESRLVRERGRGKGQPKERVNAGSCVLLWRCAGRRGRLGQVRDVMGQRSRDQVSGGLIYSAPELGTFPEGPVHVSMSSDLSV